ncbi:MAG: ABC transporter permease [Lachnospiraceae bacterium]|nr:ABC transporter permease [Lachnospiraceae bacterium]
MKLIRELWNYREMIVSLVQRDLKSRYKGSVLGFLWMLLNPLLQLCVYTIVFSTILRTGIEKFYLFLFVALVPWIFFSTCLSGGTTVILGQQDMVKKIYFPREVLPIAYTTSQFVNMLLSFIVIFVVVFFSGITIELTALLYLPVIMLIEYVLSLGITLLVSGLTVYLRDMQQILSILSMAWMYMTPVVYSVEMIPKEYVRFFYLNPMTPVIIAYRDILYYGRAPKMGTLANAVILGIAILIIGEITFSRLQRGFAEEL